MAFSGPAILTPGPTATVRQPTPAAMWSLRSFGTGPGIYSARDQIYGGTGRITGTVTVKGTPAHRRVILLERKTHIVVRSTWAAGDGTYSFDWLDPNLTYTIIAHDYTGQYNAVVADNVTPEAMP